jgi:putative transcriptional regulator
MARMSFDLTGSLLISTPAIGDPRFARAVIYICTHSADGTFGLVINRPIPMLRLGQVLDQIGIAPEGALPDAPVLGGGPVETQRGFVLYRDDWPDHPAETRLPGGLALSASTEVLGAIARGAGPSEWLLALGYAGWGPRQLEGELAQNAWLTRAADPALVFSDQRGDALWIRALREMGVDPATLSARAGRA